MKLIKNNFWKLTITLLALTFSCTLIICAAGCGDNNTTDTSNTNSTKSTAVDTSGLVGEYTEKGTNTANGKDISDKYSIKNNKFSIKYVKTIDYSKGSDAELDWKQADGTITNVEKGDNIKQDYKQTFSTEPLVKDDAIWYKLIVKWDDSSKTENKITEDESTIYIILNQTDWKDTGYITYKIQGSSSSHFDSKTVLPIKKVTS